MGWHRWGRAGNDDGVVTRRRVQSYPFPDVMGPRRSDTRSETENKALPAATKCFSLCRRSYCCNLDVPATREPYAFAAEPCAAYLGLRSRGSFSSGLLRGTIRKAHDTMQQGAQKVQCPARKKQVERADEEVIFLRLTMRWARESLSGPCWADLCSKVGKDSRRGRRKCSVVIKCIKNQAREGRRNLARLSKTICERNPTNERPRECSKEGNG